MSRFVHALAGLTIVLVASSLPTPLASADSGAADADRSRALGQSLTFARAGDKIIEGRVVTQDPASPFECNLDHVSDKQLEPANVRGCVGLDDVKVTAFDANRRVLATALTYASDRPEGPAHGYYYLHVPAGTKYRVEFAKPGYRRDAAKNIKVQESAPRGTRVWGGLKPKDVASVTRIASGAFTGYGNCERIKIPFTVGYANAKPASKKYPKHLSGRIEVTRTREGDRVTGGKFLGSYKGKATVSLAPFRLRVGRHDLTITYSGYRVKGPFADVAPSSVRHRFRVFDC